MTIDFVQYDWDYGTTTPTTMYGSYRIGDGEWVDFSDESSIVLGFVPVGTPVYLRDVEVDTSIDEIGCSFEYYWDSNAEMMVRKVTPSSEGASCKLYYYG